MKTWLPIVATVFAIIAIGLLVVMVIAELDPNAASMFGMYPL